MGLLLRLSVLALCGPLCRALLVNNGVEGEPEVECGPNHITVNVNTLNPFEGHVFVKGRFAEEGCRNSETTGRTAGLRLVFEECGVSRVRALRPRGVFVEVTLIASFHPLFVTKVDRAYKVQCFYMEADKTVEAEQILDVSFNLDALSHVPVELVTQGVPMPVCRYEVLDDGPTGAPILFAEVGQQVFHKWTCDSETVDTFCMVVRDCFVDDKQGAKVDLINGFGCAEDRFLLNNVEYSADLMAGVTTNVFKYADRPQLAFQCQISIFVKEPLSACPRPFCAQPGGRGAGSENLKEGPPPTAPDHPFPLGPGSPYKAKDGAVAPNQDPIPIPQDINANRNRDHVAYADAGAPAPPPAIAGYLDGRNNYETQDRASLRSRLYNQYRSRRSVGALADVGTVDVRAELSALEVEERVSLLPPSASRPALRVGRGEVCVSSPTVGLFLGGAALLLVAAVAFLACALLKAPAKR